MHRFVLAFVVSGCLSNPTVEVDQQSLDIPRGAHADLLVSIDGAAGAAHELLWTVEDEQIATVTPSFDGYHLRVGGDLEGETVVHVYSYGQDIAIPTRVGAPAIVRMWTEPPQIDALVGSEVQITAKTLDTLARVQDITYTSRWQVRDESVVTLDQSGMLLRAVGEGETTLHVANGTNGAVVPVAIFK